MATRKLTLEQDRAVVALMRTTYSERTGKTWIFPTDESVRLEREFNGSLDAARERVAKFKQTDETPVAIVELPRPEKLSTDEIDALIKADVDHAKALRKLDQLRRKPVGYSTVAVETQVAIPVEVAPVIEAKEAPAAPRLAAPVYKLFSACATKQHAHCTGAHFESNGDRVVCTCKHHRQSDMFTTVKSVQTGFSFLK